MSALNKILAGTAGLAAMIGLASPAAAQYYPNYGYPGYGNPGYGYGYGYGNNVGNAVGQAINGVIGALQYGQYPYGNYGYGQSYYGIPANVAVDRCARAVEGRLSRGYGGGGRVTGIINVEARNSGALRVHGYASDYSGYGYGQPNLSFTCRVNRYAQVEDLSFDNRVYGFNGYNRGYRGW